MKASVSPAATARVLARIDRATSDTAAAVERVLQTATPGLMEPSWGYDVSREICDGLGIEHADDVERCGARRCPYCWGDSDEADEISPDDLPGLVAWFDARPALLHQQPLYAPEMVSPHLAGLPPELSGAAPWQAEIARQVTEGHSMAGARALWDEAFAAAQRRRARTTEGRILYGTDPGRIQGQSADIIIWDDLPPEAS